MSLYRTDAVCSNSFAYARAISTRLYRMICAIAIRRLLVPSVMLFATGQCVITPAFAESFRIVADPYLEQRPDPKLWLDLLPRSELRRIDRVILETSYDHAARYIAAETLLKSVSTFCGWPQDLATKATYSFNRVVLRDKKMQDAVTYFRSHDYELWSEVVDVISAWFTAEAKSKEFCETHVVRESRRYITEHLNRVFEMAKSIEDKTSHRKIDTNRLIEYCLMFYRDPDNLLPLMSDMEQANFSVVEGLTSSTCMSSMSSIIKKRIPLVHLMAETPFDYIKRKKTIYAYFKRNKNHEGYAQVMNARSDYEGMTFLDYLKHMHDMQSNYINQEKRDAYVEMLNYVCQNGGVFSYYKEARCTPGGASRMP